MSKGYFTVDQLVARFGGISRRTIFNWRRDLGFPSPVGPGRKHYRIEDVLAWEEKHFSPEREVVNG